MSTGATRSFDLRGKWQRCETFSEFIIALSCCGRAYQNY
ncbi:hypothetical protein T11_11372 [Trichinella zimbabwensis]|uniref:Uncharacterized protein n=1 Tax=Trichinella zimbabwensis TaxID=268475 RepID=A0A0V1H6U4_9BILA|nr:hypothetical protein T11_11372 [Trichinella zimbabwensis]